MTTWKVDKQISSGHGETAHLWNLLDANERIVDRTVIKTLHIKEDQIIQEGPGKGQLLQAYIQQTLVPHESTEAYTVPTLAVRKIPELDNVWRTFHPYYSLGNLEELVHVNTRSRLAKPLPEPFIWFLLHRMMKAAVDMDEKLQTTPGSGPCVIHNDIKSENILLGQPGSLGKDSDYIMYPPAYLGGFNFSYLTSDDESWRQKIMGTVGWRAPELDREDNHDTLTRKARYDVAPTSKTNVWQIGYCVLQTMEGHGLPSPDPDDRDLRYRNDKWTKITTAGISAFYSADLIRTVEPCVRFEMKDRPSPQAALAQIEQFMPKHADQMDRWGTLSWIKAEHARTPEAKDDDDRGEADDENEEDEEDATLDISTAVGEKRKPSGGAKPPAKRRRYTGALQRRLELVATQMKSGARIGRVKAVDHQFVLANKHKLIYPNNKLFDPKEFFENADPGVIELERDTVSVDADGEAGVDGDAGAESATRPKPRVRAESEVPAPRASRKSLASRPKSAPPKLNGIGEARGSYYFTAGDKAVLETDQARYQAAINHWNSKWPDPKTISSNNWKLEQARFAFNSKKATNVSEKNYWMSRSIQAQSFAEGKYKSGRDSDLHIKLALQTWKKGLDGEEGFA
ncbi:hypothetical protein KCU93_g4934, partial [Aureobasidium melanogenum]